MFIFLLQASKTGFQIPICVLEATAEKTHVGGGGEVHSLEVYVRLGPEISEKLLLGLSTPSTSFQP